MICKNSFITVKQGIGGDHYYVTLEYLLKKLGIEEMRLNKSYSVSEYKIESWINSAISFKKLISIKKMKSPTYIVSLENLSSITVSDSAYLFVDGELKNVRDIKKGDIIQGLKKLIKVYEVKQESKNDFVYELKVEDDAPYFTGSALVK